MQTSQSDVECCLLTWHGTLLCSAPDRSALHHAPLTDPRTLASGCRLTIQTSLDKKFSRLVPIHDEELPYVSERLGNGVARRTWNGRGFNFSRNGRFLCASTIGALVDWTRERPEDWEAFLPIPVEVIARLASLAGHDWVDLKSAELVAAPTIEFKAGFELSFGRLLLDLAKTYPVFFSGTHTPTRESAGESVFLVAQDGQMAAFAYYDEVPHLRPKRLWLRRAEQDKHQSHLQAVAGGQSGQALAALLTGQERLYYPPTFAHRDDRAFFINRARNGQRPRLGYTRSEIGLGHSRNAYLFLQRSLEGTLFDNMGVRRCYGFLDVLEDQPKWLTREGDRHFIDRTLLDQTPLLEGEYLIFYNGNIQNYYHWLTESILSLFVLRRARGADAKIVLPARLGHVSGLQYLEALKLFGLGDIDIIFSPAPLVKVEQASWIDSGELVEDLPEQIFQDFQSVVTASIGATLGQRRIYVEREYLRQVDNADEIRTFLEGLGFLTVRLDGLSLVEQVKLFASAEFIVSPHGAGLSNLIFTPPAARVIEFMPDMEMRPFFWMISRKLGHEYGMLPCPTDTGTFNGKLRVDLPKLTRLVQLLEHA